MLRSYYPKYKPVGDKALAIEMGDQISISNNNSIRAIVHLLDKEKIIGIKDRVPSYTCLIIHYDPACIRYEELIKVLDDILKRADKKDVPCGKVIELPTYYGEDCGTDIEYVAQYHGISIEDVIELHSSVKYPVYFIGFTPGFPVLGGMHPTLVTPRLDNPRLNIPAGSVGIGGNQTGVYPVKSPGGWRIIGRTPIRLYNPKDDDPTIIKPGDYVKFRPIGKDEYNKLVKMLGES